MNPTSSCYRVFLLSTVLFLSGCFDTFEQSYLNYSDLKRMHNPRLQGWFPDIVDEDAYNLKETHSIGPIESLGKFSYGKQHKIDTLLSNREIYRPSTVDSFKQFISSFKSIQVPEWFIKVENYAGKMVFRKQDTYFIQSKEDRTIYFAYKFH